MILPGTLVDVLYHGDWEEGIVIKASFDLNRYLVLNTGSITKEDQEAYIKQNCVVKRKIVKGKTKQNEI